MQNPSKLKHYVLIVTNNITSLIFDGFFYIIENTLGISIALIDIRRRKKIGKKILLCMNKNYSLHSGFDSMDKHTREFYGAFVKDERRKMKDFDKSLVMPEFVDYR